MGVMYEEINKYSIDNKSLPVHYRNAHREAFIALKAIPHDVVDEYLKQTIFMKKD